MFNWLLNASLGNRLLVLVASAILMIYGALQLPQTAVGKVDKNALRRALPGHLTPTLNCF